MLAGEASGDHHAALVVEQLRRRASDLSFWGLGGPDLAAQGVRLLAGLDDLAVMGFAEVARRIGYFMRLERDLVRRMQDGQADLVLAVDYPGLNLRLARRARDLGIPVLYYISPQVWAWKAHRARHLARDARHVAVILPFEEALLREAGASVSFVGHPLLDRPAVTAQARAAVRAEVGAASGDRLIAVLPGSRRQELERHLDPFVGAARRLEARFVGSRAVLAAAPGVDVRALARTGLPVTHDTRALLESSRVALVKSGTSTLEAALAGVPFVCAYRTSPITWALARRLVRVPHIALANLVVDERVVPELLQDEVDAERLADVLAGLMDDGPAREAQIDGLARVRAALGRPGAARRTAEIALELLGRSGPARPGSMTGEPHSPVPDVGPE